MSTPSPGRGPSGTAPENLPGSVGSETARGALRSDPDRAESRSGIAERGSILTIGFATTVAIWAMAYLSMAGPGLVIGEALFALLLMCLLTGGVVAGRVAMRPITAGVRVGLVAATLNLLIVGSLFGRDSTSEMIAAAAWWIPANFAASILLGALGGWIGAQFPADHTMQRNWVSRFAAIAACAVFLLLITGGLVTGWEAGLAVDDWPQTFGHNMFLYPVTQMKGGVFYEHAHRLYGALVGLTTITLAVVLWRTDNRAWLRALGIFAVVMVIAQGIMGGLRVSERSIALAIAHGIFAQVFFVTLGLIWAFTTREWRSERAMQGQAAEIPEPSLILDRRFALALLAVVFLQLVFGALYRHFYSEAEKVPWPAQVHFGIAAVVAALGVMVGVRIWAHHSQKRILRRIAAAVILLIAIQLVLGFIAFIAVLARRDGANVFEVITTTAHQANGALVFAASAQLVAWTQRWSVQSVIKSAVPSPTLMT